MVAVATATEALEVCARCCPDLVFLDMVLPGLHGLDAVRALRAVPGCERTTLVALTGIEDAIFVHPGRFIGGAKTEDGALKLARLAVAE